MLLERHIKKKLTENGKIKKNTENMEQEKGAIAEDNKFIKDLSNGLKKKHAAKLEAIRSQEKVDEMVEDKKKEVKADK